MATKKIVNSYGGKVETNAVLTFKDKCTNTELKLCIFPRRCYITEKNLWMKEAYVQSVDWLGPGGIRTEYRWYDQEAFVIERLKGNV